MPCNLAQLQAIRNDPYLAIMYRTLAAPCPTLLPARYGKSLPALGRSVS